MKGVKSGSVAASKVVVHPVTPEDSAIMDAIRVQARAAKGALRGVNARVPYDALMERVVPRAGVTFEPDVVGGVPGLWVRARSSDAATALLHLHGGWFNFGTATAYRHLVAHIADRASTDAFVPDYRLAPEHSFPAAINDVVACYGALRGDKRRLVVTGDSAGGNLALALASQVSADPNADGARLVGIAAVSPITDLTLSGETYETRAASDPYFTKAQAADLVHSYLGKADPKDPRASPLYAPLAALPPLQIHVGDDEILLDDSRRYVERALASGVDARLDVWMGMPHGFVISVGAVKAAGEALDAIGTFLAERLRGRSR
ncbi:MAG TPA: alpha/beta hydrolase [Gemmatimonadales bacterium]|nr:alpha/beta hydrolase [Gemmatimonadales bacterium]